jgi:hypothetical protein
MMMMMAVLNSHHQKFYRAHQSTGGKYLADAMLRYEKNDKNRAAVEKMNVQVEPYGKNEKRDKKMQEATIEFLKDAT